MLINPNSPPARRQSETIFDCYTPNFLKQDIILPNKSILLLDEDPEILKFLSLVFEERGLRVLRARSRTEALEVLSRQFIPVDLILANIVITHLSETDFEADVASVRMGVRILYMSAFVEDGMFRVETMKRPYPVVGDNGGYAIAHNEGLVNAVMSALTKARAQAGAG